MTGEQGVLEKLVTELESLPEPTEHFPLMSLTDSQISNDISDVLHLHIKVKFHTKLIKCR